MRARGLTGFDQSDYAMAFRLRRRLRAQARAIMVRPPGGDSTPVEIGASPSGKAADFDSAMRRFESSRPSHSLFTPRSLFLHAVLVCETGAAMRVRDASPRNISLENRFERRMIEISVAGKIFSSMIQVVVV